ncbi:MAG TPA: hypothetical protein ENN40_06530 [Candidatus Aminicenantes bacterium]|nr:hypothetical protein [Candidatus Aminicenantes bacterium]
MKKPNFDVSVLFVAVACLFLLVTSVVAQGTSSVKVTDISLSPTTFKAGDLVTVKVTLRNEATATYGCNGMEAAVYAFKAKPFTVSNQLWQAKQGVAPMTAGATKEVTFSAKFTVPSGDYPVLYFMAWSPVCAPDEFGQTAQLEVNQECVYRFRPRMMWIRPIHARPIRKPVK